MSYTPTDLIEMARKVIVEAESLKIPEGYLGISYPPWYWDILDAAGDVVGHISLDADDKPEIKPLTPYPMKTKGN